MPEIERLLGVAGDDLLTAEKASEKAHEGIKKAEEVSVEVQALSKRIKEILDETDRYVNEYVPVIKSDLGNTKTVISEITVVIDQMIDKEETFDEVHLRVKNSTNKIDEVVEALQFLEKTLKMLMKQIVKNKLHLLFVN